MSGVPLPSAPRRRPWRIALAAATAAVVLFGGALLSPAASADESTVSASKAPLAQRDDSVVTADALPTVQIDSGYVWAQATSGNTVYAAGSFSNARAALADPGTNLTPRSNILAFDITTGDLLDFAPEVNGVIKAVAVSSDGSRVYIGGSFNRVNGQSRWGFAALDAVTGALVSGFSPSVGGAGVYALAVTDDTVYVAGNFTQANGVARKNLAAFATSNGALRSWAPTADLQVDAIVVEPGATHIIAGGRFGTVNGVTQRGLVALDPVSGEIDTSWLAPQTVKNGLSTGTSAGKAGIFSLATDGSGVYGTGWDYSSSVAGNLEGTFAADAGTGAIRWVADCHGDHYGVYSTGSTVYATGHTHACETTNLWPEQSTRTHRYIEAYTTTAEGTLTKSAQAGSGYADWSGTPSPSVYSWFPDFTVGTATGLGQAGLSITGSGDYIAVAGEFTTVNNQRYQGIVRFSTNPSTGSKQGPRLSSTTWSAPTATSVVPGRVRVSIPQNWDRDDLDLTYQLLRAGTTEPVAEKVVSSTWWQTSATVELDDTSSPPGSTQSYTVRVVDSDGNAVTSRSVSATVAEGDSSGYAYADTVLSDGASIYYPLGSVDADWSGSNQPSFGTGVSASSTGAVTGTTGTSSSQFDGSSTGRVSSTTSVPSSDVFSAEAWFRTTTTSGGKIVGFGNKATGDSGSYDRHVYMSNSGQLLFGVYAGTSKTVSSTASYNDGEWHHVVASQSSAGIQLYVDGTLVGSDSTVTSAQPYYGYWRIGGDNISGWPSAPSSKNFSGTIDEVAIYSSALSADQIMNHYATGKGLVAPTASFTQAATELSVAFDAAASSADTGTTITGYSWDFGDGSTAGTGVAPAHAYATAGTYDVTLTVTDSRGLTGTVTTPVTVLAANVLPTASFTASADGLSVALDAASSADSDGTIAAYSWDFGDGSAAGTGAAATHAYTADGTYTVTLTVTDDRGGVATSSQDVTVAAPTVVYAAKDDFERTASAGWGSADLGGAWTVSGGAASAASVADGAGVVTLAPSGTRNLTLGTTALRDVAIQAEISLDKGPDAGGSYAGVIARSSGSDNYTVRAWLHANGSVWLVVQRGSTVLASKQISGLTRVAGDVFTISVEVTGEQTTTLSAKIWKNGTEEPTAWQLTAQDASGLAAGAVGVHASRSGSATGTGVFRIDDFRVTDLG